MGENYCIRATDKLRGEWYNKMIGSWLHDYVQLNFSLVSPSIIRHCLVYTIWKGAKNCAKPSDQAGHATCQVWRSSVTPDLLDLAFERHQEIYYWEAASVKELQNAKQLPSRTPGKNKIATEPNW